MVYGEGAGGARKAHEGGRERGRHDARFKLMMQLIQSFCLVATNLLCSKHLARSQFVSQVKDPCRGKYYSLCVFLASHC